MKKLNKKQFYKLFRAILSTVALVTLMLMQSVFSVSKKQDIKDVHAKEHTSKVSHE